MSHYRGSCHCGGVRFEIDTEQPLGPYFRCNCSLCSRKSAVMGAAPRSALSVTAGADILSTYTWNTREAEHFFCSRCGIYTHHVMRGEVGTVGINMACLQGVDVDALGDVEVGDGRSWSVVHDDAGLENRSSSSSASRISRLAGVPPQGKHGPMHLYGTRALHRVWPEASRPHRSSE